MVEANVGFARGRISHISTQLSNFENRSSSANTARNRLSQVTLQQLKFGKCADSVEYFAELIFFGGTAQQFGELHFDVVG